MLQKLSKIYEFMVILENGKRKHNYEMKWTWIVNGEIELGLELRAMGLRKIFSYIFKFLCEEVNRNLEKDDS